MLMAMAWDGRDCGFGLEDGTLWGANYYGVQIMLSKVESVFHWPQEGIKNEILLDFMPEGSLALSVQREF